jgi:surfeit locus 1 family protein
MLRLLLRPRWIFIHLLVALIVAVCAGLGRWQLNRLEERRTENARIARQTSLPAQGLEELLPSPGVPARLADDFAYRRVRVRGTYDTNRELVLLTRSNGDEAGNHLLTPLVISRDAAVIVDRGWVPLNMNSPPVPQAAPPDGPADVTGVLLPSEGRGRFGPGDSSGRAKATSRVDLERLANQLPYQTYPLYLRLETQRPSSGRSLPQPVPLPPSDEGPHLSYAVQWFVFGALALITYGALIRREVRSFKGISEDGTAAEPQEITA